MKNVIPGVPELLAPAGDWDSFRAAVENGADAVYLGGRLFNARQNACNFSDDELKKAIDYAHSRGVNVYLTMNTLLADDEMDTAVKFVGQAYIMGIDAIIVQDIGFAAVVGKLLPDLPLHASTQMTVYNLKGVEVLEKMGFKRVVPARELSLGEITKITVGTSLEVEVFVHGALCVSYSGQCLMSSIIGGRSGNRGKCAQPCRLPYRLEKTGTNVSRGYLLSSKDLCSADILNQMEESGINSLKIEGRMKTPEYVAVVTGIYRKYLDLLKAGKYSGVCNEDMEALMLAFNRGGFSHGYLQGKTGRDMMAYEKPKNWGIYIGTVESLNPAVKEVRVRLDGELSIGDGIEVWSGDGESPGTVVSSIKVRGIRTEEAKSGQYADIGYISGSMKKGDRVYKTSSKKLNLTARKSFEKTAQRVTLDGRLEIREKRPVFLEISDGLKTVRVEGPLPEKAVNSSIDREKAASQLLKTGGTPYKFRNMQIELDEGLAVPARILNELRRKALEEIETERIKRYSRCLPHKFVETDIKKLYFPGNYREFVEKDINNLYFPGNSRNNVHISGRDINYSVFICKFDGRKDYSLLNTERVCIPFQAVIKPEISGLLAKMAGKGIRIFAWLPSVTRGNYEKIIKTAKERLQVMGLSGIYIGNLGNLHIASDINMEVFGDYSLNLFNSFTMQVFAGMGFKGVTISPELNIERIENLCIPVNIDAEAVVYGRLTVMTSEYCPVGALEGGFSKQKRCKGTCCGSEYRLKDRKGAEFPVLTDPSDCRSTILNSTILYVPELQKRLSKIGVNIMRLNMFEESVDEMNEILGLYREVVKNESDRGTPHAATAEKIRTGGFTRGHYLKGV